MSTPPDIIKRDDKRGSESFSADKLHKSIVAACLSVRTPVGQAEAIAKAVTASVVDWLENKPEVTASDIRKIAARYLNTHHSDAAYMYEHHKKVL